MPRASSPGGRASGPAKTARTTPCCGRGPARLSRLRTKRARADGAAEQTNRSGLTVGYLGNFFSDGRPESDQAAVWRRRSAKPRLMGPTRPLSYGELVDVNDQGQAAGMIGRFTRSGFPLVKPAVWKAGWPRLRTIPVPAAPRNANRVVITQLHDINAHGAIVGDVFGLTTAGLRRPAPHRPGPLDLHVRRLKAASACRPGRRPAFRRAGGRRWEVSDVPFSADD